MKLIRWTAAVITGLILAALPFLRYGIGGAHGHGAAPHSDHEPHHGGQVLMLGAHHVELVDRDGAVELYLSDASRRPIHPARASVSFDGGPEVPLVWRGYRSFVRKPPKSETGVYRLSVKGGSPLVLRWP